MILGIDHVGIAVRDVAHAADAFARLVDQPAPAAEELASQRVRLCFVPAAAPNLEILAPLDDASDSPISRFLFGRGEGMHHVCFLVDDVETELTRLADEGFQLVDQTPRQGHGGRVAFMHPKSLHGVLVELLERTTYKAQPDIASPPLLRAARDGDRRALARLLTLIETGGDAAEAIIEAALPLAAGAHLVGITGAPGVGKSTLVAALARELRLRGNTVAILAVDPTSPYTGGALLGDRVRMQTLHGDPGVFIRSMATRGAGAGGLAAAATGAATVLGAAGFDHVLVETVGAGQGELDVALAAQTTVVVAAPGMGDDVQALKAGILEIGDVLVVNKADRDGADQLVADLTFAIGSRAAPHPDSTWAPPILATEATTGTGVAALIDALTAHRQWLQTRDRVPERDGDTLNTLLAERRIVAVAAARIVEELAEHARRDGSLLRLAGAVAGGTLTPTAAARRLLERRLFERSAVR